MGSYDRPTILRARTKAQNAREDTTCLLLAKMVHIAEDNGRPLYTFIDELKETPERMANVVHSLLGLVVQYAENAQGFLKLCEFLTQRIADQKLDQLPGLETRW